MAANPELDAVALFAGPGGMLADKVGPPIASAATIAPTRPVHHVTGVAAIVTITPPWEGFSGPIMLIADAIWTWTAAGNIFVGRTPTTARRGFVFLFDKKTSKMHP